MKAYAISVSIKVRDKATTYPEVAPIDVEFKENLPDNVDAHKHLRARIAEELTRAFAVRVVIDNKSEDAQEEDALS